MSDYRHEANNAAQRAFRRMLENHLRTGEWNPTLVAAWNAAERDFDGLTEPELDALHEATMADLADLEALDVPLAVFPFSWTPVELVFPEGEARVMWGNR